MSKLFGSKSKKRRLGAGSVSGGGGKKRNHWDSTTWSQKLHNEQHDDFNSLPTKTNHHDDADGRVTSSNVPTGSPVPLVSGSTALTSRKFVHDSVDALDPKQSETFTTPASSKLPGHPSPTPSHRTTNGRTFADLGLLPSLVKACARIGFKTPTQVQRQVIPTILNGGHVLALAPTGSGKTAAFILPILHNLSMDPYGIYAIILSPTRELAIQIHEQCIAIASSSIGAVKSLLIIGGMDQVRQGNLLTLQRPHIVVATPGRLGYLLRDNLSSSGGGGGGASGFSSMLRHLRFIVLDEADRLLSPGGFERDVAQVLLSSSASGSSTAANINKCQTLLFSATMTGSLRTISKLASGGRGRLPLQRIIIESNFEIKMSHDEGEEEKEKEGNDQKVKEFGREQYNDNDDASVDDQMRIDIKITKQQSAQTDQSNKNFMAFNTINNANNGSQRKRDLIRPRIPSGLRQEYIFMPSRVRDTYLVAALRALMHECVLKKSLAIANGDDYDNKSNSDIIGVDQEEEAKSCGARSAIIFVSTCERAARLERMLIELFGKESVVALHGLLSQDRRAASLGKFKSHFVRILVATDVASRGLDIPEVDLVLNAELPRNAEDYVHRVGRTARAGKRGLAVSLVGERDVALVHAAEKLGGREMLKCEAVKDEEAVRLLGSVTKASRLAKMKLMEIGFDSLVKIRLERRDNDRKERSKARRAAAKVRTKGKNNT